MIHLKLQQRLTEVVRKQFPDVDPALFQVRPCPDTRFGDYQCSGFMTLAKQRKANPRALAEAAKAQLAVEDLCETVDIAGAGFLNFKLSAKAVATELAEALASQHPFTRPSDTPRTVVIDFSSPNVAKPMHVGHIRSTILGDCLSRVQRRLGHRVVTDNHIGDWGTQFGKLLVGWKGELDEAALARDPIGEMERLYKRVNEASEKDPGVLEAARAELVRLQAGDEVNLGIWRRMIELSQVQFDTVYGRLGIRFDHTLGESFYNPWLKQVVEEIRKVGLARESDGAVVVFFDDLPELKAHPALIQKSDGAANYTTTDLATLDYRLRTWAPDQIIYVTDGRQQLHFRQLFEVFRRWRPEEEVRLEHVWFGSIQGEDGKPFKTRSGEVIRLSDLLDEAEERAFAMVTSKNPDMPEPQRREIARVVGIGAVKYSDLLPNRQSDYVFSWDKMLAMNGNTAPYLQYACTRIRSIFRKGTADPAGGIVAGAAVDASVMEALGHPDELALAKHLLIFGLILEAVAEECRPNYLCNYLYDLAGRFARFYESCPVLKVDGAQRTARLALCQLAGAVLSAGLDCLGIETPDQM